MDHEHYEERLKKKGLSPDAIRVAMVLTETFSDAGSRDAAIIEFCQHAPESERWEAARLRWRRFSAEEITNAHDVYMARSAYFHTPRGSPEEALALKRWIALAATPEEILEVYWETPDQSNEQNSARDKLIAYFEDLIKTLDTDDA